jgi:hypothetical protein
MTMKKEYVKNLKLLTQMITTGANEEEVREQAKKVLELGNLLISTLEEE